MGDSKARCNVVASSICRTTSSAAVSSAPTAVWALSTSVSRRTCTSRVGSASCLAVAIAVVDPSACQWSFPLAKILVSSVLLLFAFSVLGSCVIHGFPPFVKTLKLSKACPPDNRLLLK